MAMLAVPGLAWTSQPSDWPASASLLAAEEWQAVYMVGEEEEFWSVAVDPRPQSTMDRATEEEEDDTETLSPVSSCWKSSLNREDDMISIILKIYISRFKAQTSYCLY